ncbi:MAG: 16S rRNA (guanine(527)-N(7))-methyltransferase RsmG [Spirochaetes bacterium]|nr:16S rRNA (guanine(527)-N(7))-methyltransferase RsmG [Spirochaetota bacterium]MBU1079876.1 16S rRNA (guanine(527)-N(7))-methyltransferase RsmG [Spirochaetota bacterium]
MTMLGLLERGLSELGVLSAGAVPGAEPAGASQTGASPDGAAAGADAEARGRLARYVEAIEEWNPAYGLVGASGDELIIKHILDSLAPVPVIDGLLASRPVDGERPVLVDLGTGAGLPGIPISIARPGLDVVLLDRMTRRIRFLEAMQSRLALANVQIVEEQVERARGSFDIVTFRAFRPFERKLFKRVFSVCAPGGFVVAYKGKAERARAELAEIDGLYSSAEIVPVKVPFLDDERCVVVMRPARR